MRALFKPFVAVLLFLLTPFVFAEDVVIIAHSDVPHLTPESLQKLFTGRSVSVEGVLITPINAQQGSDLRRDFLNDYLNQTEDKYQAYWTVRQFVGKGRPPKSFNNKDDIIQFVRSTKGAVGYLHSKDVPSDMNVVLRK